MVSHEILIIVIYWYRKKILFFASLQLYDLLQIFVVLKFVDRLI